jgi:phosphoribosylformylglycinamidine cyclo-ligase
MYEGEDYDLAGFCVGVVEEDGVIDGSRLQPGDRLIALGASGPHSNGYSLIRRILAQASDPDARVDGRPLREALMEPTRIYVKSVLALIDAVEVRCLSHITGGGLTENLPRVMPAGTRARIDTDSWQWPEVFRWLQKEGQVETAEMYRTFNCGVGMVIGVAEADLDQALAVLEAAGENAWMIGQVEAGDDTPEVVFEGSRA